MNSFKEKYQITKENFKKELDIYNINKKHEKYYSKEFEDIFKNELERNYKLLKENFPNTFFDLRGRIKNQFSLKEKIKKKLNTGHTGNIYDVFGMKIVVYSYFDYENNTTKNDENKLIEICKDMQNFLIENSPTATFDKIHSKNYIDNPKKNGYQALHCVRKYQHKNKFGLDDAYYSEVQIRTFREEENQKYGIANHFGYKPNYDTLNPNLMPAFFGINKFGKAYKLSKKESIKKRNDEYNEFLK